ncbi:MAG TPA: hypothetical protein VF783_23920 [Terriglobales bacterium]
MNFPKWTGDPVEYTVAEVKNGKTFPYANAEINRFSDTDNPADKLVSVQSVVVDSGGNRLWILDTGVIDDKVKPGGQQESERARLQSGRRQSGQLVTLISNS